MSRSLALITLVVPDYDTALSFFVGKLGFTVLEDTPLGDGKRWVVVAPSGDGETKLLIAQATTESQEARIGDQTGGRVFLFLQTDDFDNDYQRYCGAGVYFLEEPREEAYGKVAVFEDCFGNKWDLIEYRPNL